MTTTGSPREHFHMFVFHRHDGWHPARGRFTRGWHGHVWFRHAHTPAGRPHPWVHGPTP